MTDTAELIARLQGLSRWLDAAAYRDAPSGELRMAVTEAADALSSLVRERDAYAQATKDQAAIAMHNVNRATAAEADAARMREALEATEDMVYAAAVEQYNAGCDPSVYGEPKEKQHWFAYDILENLADAIRARASLSNTSEGGERG